MAPKKEKVQKMALTDFLQDSTLGSWADEMDSLPTAPAGRADDGGSHRDFANRGPLNDGYEGRESRYPPREELPLPTAPPYTAFVGNLSFDVHEQDVEDFFGVKLRSIKIIKDRDDRPKGFGYVEFESLQDLKDGLAKSGQNMAGRTVRVSVAEPPKERERHGQDEDRTAGAWVRGGPLPPREDRGFSRGPSNSRYADNGPDRGERMGFGSRFVPSAEGSPRIGGGSRLEPAAPTEAETNSDWRSTAKARVAPTPERPGPPRRSSGFNSTPEGPTHAADTEQTWSKGSKFQPSPSEPTNAPPQKEKGFFRRDSARGDAEEPSDWRSAPRRAPSGPTNGRGGFDRSPNDSVPTTPNMGRRKLELLPRTASHSSANSPVGSPKSSTPSGARANPFGSARPVDAAAREREIEEKLLKEREARHMPTESPRSAGRSPEPSHAQLGDPGNWRDRRGPSNSRPASTSHSRATSHDGGIATPPTPTGPGKKYQPPASNFGFTALQSEIDIIEGEDEEHHDAGHSHLPPVAEAV